MEAFVLYVALLSFVMGFCIGAGGVIVACWRKAEAMARARQMMREAREAQLRGY